MTEALETAMPVDVEDELDRESPEPEPEEPRQDGSVWAVARQAHAEHVRKQQEREPLFVDIGEDGIVMRCRWVRLGDLEKSTKGIAQLRSTTKQALFASLDTIHLACDELLVRLPVGLVPLADEGDPPVRFDHALCDGMGWPRDGMTARKIVYKLFGGRNGEYAILDAAQEITSWVKSAGTGAAEDFDAG